MKLLIALLLIGTSSSFAFGSEPDEASEGAFNAPLHKPIVTTTDAPHGPDAGTDIAEESVDTPPREPVTELTPISSHAPASISTPAPTPAPTPTSTPTPSSKPTASPAAALEKVEGVTADQSLKWLENGNTRFVTKKFRADGKTDADRARVAQSPKPHAIVLSCSDSRVPPELIFDQALGEITTIRVAGEVPDASVIASIEQTLLNEHPHLLVVLGHTQCASIETALSWKESPSAGSESLDRMVAEIKPHLKTVSQTARSAGLAAEAALQADAVARELQDHSEIIKKAVESGSLKIKSALYRLESGQVKFY